MCHASAQGQEAHTLVPTLKAKRVLFIFASPIDQSQALIESHFLSLNEITTDSFTIRRVNAYSDWYLLIILIALNDCRYHNHCHCSFSVDGEAERAGAAAGRGGASAHGLGASHGDARDPATQRGTQCARQGHGERLDGARPGWHHLRRAPRAGSSPDAAHVGPILSIEILGEILGKKYLQMA